MTQEEKVREALDDVERMRKDIATLKTMDLEAALQTGGPRVRRGSAMTVQHGSAVTIVKNGFLVAGDGETILAGPVMGICPDPENPDGMDHSLHRTTTPMRKKHQVTSLGRVWKYRNFKRCGTCGCYNTYKSRSLAETQDIELWCYECGAQDDEVLKDYEPLPTSEPKQRECVLCGTEIWVTRGDRMFPTGEIDQITQKPDYCCEKCNESSKKGENKK